jgi:hypothetical protein
MEPDVVRGPPGAESLAADGQLPDQVGTAPGCAGCARPRPAALPAHSAGRQPQLPRSDRRLPPRPRAQLGIGAPDAVLVLFYDVRQWTMRSLPILRYQERGADRCAGRSRPAPNNRRPAVASWSASRQHGQPDRLGEHEMPTPFSTQRRRPAVESTHIRRFTRTMTGGSACHCRIQSDCRRPRAPAPGGAAPCPAPAKAPGATRSPLISHLSL